VDSSEAIKGQVPLYRILGDYGVPFSGGGTPEQIHCPFHGEDKNKSARIYPENDSMYCWVCDKTWDVIEFVRDKEGLSYGQTLSHMVHRYNVTVETKDYERRLWAARRASPDAENKNMDDFASSVEWMFVKFTKSLTNDKLFPILGTYNACLRELDDLTAQAASPDRLKVWFEASRERIRQEYGHEPRQDQNQGT
jgi:hypothetical protein